MTKKVITIIVDGSICNDLETKKKKRAIGWALVVDNGAQEIYGALEWKKELTGLHEHIALINGCLFALARKIAPENCIFYTDAQILSEITFHFHPDNRSAQKEVIQEQLRGALEGLQIENCQKELFDFLQKTQIKKIKSHSRLACQERTDYLARTIARQYVGSSEPILDFDTWIQKGIEIREGDEIVYWNFPFTHDL